MKLIKNLTLAIVALIFAASVLLIPAPSPVRAATCTVNHTVASGETLSSIAEKYNVSYQSIATANNLNEPYTIAVGQVLCIPGATTTTTTTAATSSSKKQTFTAEFDGKFVTIHLDNYPKKSAFYVKIGSGLPRDAQLVKIGRLNTKKNTTYRQAFRVSKAFENVRNLTVCVKNAKTDANQCQVIHMPR